MADEITKAGLIEALAPFLRGPLFESEQPNTRLEELALTYAAMRIVEKIIKTRKEMMRDAILRMLKDQKANSVHFDSLRVSTQERTAKLPGDMPFRELLAAKELGIDKGYDVVEKLVLNPSKVESLVDLGYLTQAEVDELKKTTEAVDVRLDKAFQSELENL